MRWRTPVPKPTPRHGDRRERRIFALWPRRCQDGYTRWLTPVILEQWYFDGGVWGVWETDAVRGVE